MPLSSPRQTTHAQFPVLMQVSSFASAASALPFPNPNAQAKAGPERPAMQPLLGTAPVHTLPCSPCCHFNVLTLESTCKGSPSARLKDFLCTHSLWANRRDPATGGRAAVRVRVIIMVALISPCPQLYGHYPSKLSPTLLDTCDCLHFMG